MNENDLFDERLKIDFNKPVQTVHGDSVRILCTDGEGHFPVVGIVNGEVMRWNLAGVCEGQEGDGEKNLENSPPLEKFYVTISQDGSFESEIQGLTFTPTVMAQLIVDPENKILRIQGYNDTKVEIIGEKKNPPSKRSGAAPAGDLMSGYFNSITGKRSSIDLNKIEVVDGDDL